MQTACVWCGQIVEYLFGERRPTFCSPECVEKAQVHEQAGKDLAEMLRQCGLGDLLW